MKKEPKEVELFKVNHGGREFFDGPGKPLEDLYYWGSGNPVNNHELAFAGVNLFDSPLLQEVEEITVAFDGESSNSRCREAWADPLRAEILKRLAGKSNCWYIGYRSLWPMQIYDEYSKILLDMHIVRLPMWELSRVAFVDSGYRIGMGKGIVRKPIFEVTNSEINDFVSEVWENANPAFSIEGYCLKLSRLDRIRNWNEEQRTPELFWKIINECFAMFYTDGHEPRELNFITDKMDVDEMAKLINLDELQQMALRL